MTNVNEQVSEVLSCNSQGTLDKGEMASKLRAMSEACAALAVVIEEGEK
jgi:hypothetical protein